MSDATEQFFEELGQRGYEPLVAKFSGRVRFDVVDGRRTEQLARLHRQRRRSGVTWRNGDGIASSGPTRRCSTDWRTARRTPWRRCCGARWCARATSNSCSRSNVSSQGRRGQAGERSGVDRDERQSGQDPGRQHLRGQRRTRRHRSVAHRPDRAVLVRHPVHVEMDPECERPAADSRCRSTISTTSRRNSSSCPGLERCTSTRSCRSSATARVGNGFQEQLTFLNHEQGAVDLMIRIDADCDFADLFEVKDAVPKRGTFTKRVEKNELGARLPARDIRRATVIILLGVVWVRRERVDVRGSTRTACDVDDHPAGCHRTRVGTRRCEGRAEPGVACATVAPEHGEDLARWIEHAHGCSRIWSR